VVGFCSVGDFIGFPSGFLVVNSCPRCGGSTFLDGKCIPCREDVLRAVFEPASAQEVDWTRRLLDAIATVPGTVPRAIVRLVPAWVGDGRIWTTELELEPGVEALQLAVPGKGYRQLRVEVARKKDRPVKRAKWW
jgi:hypothetical protein